MEDGFDKLLYLVISILYAIFTYSKKRTRRESPETHLPPSTTAPAWEEAVKKETPLPVHYATVKTPSASILPSAPSAAQQPPKKRILGRYKGWKKAVVMGEVMRTYL